MKRLFIILALLTLNGCSGMKLSHYSAEHPPFDIKEYFNGPIKGWGIIQDRSGNVVKRFDVSMVGIWEGDKGRLEEEFVYYDGSKDQRIWHIEKKDDENYIGTAGDIIGSAKGKQSGNAMRWNYKMDIKTGGRSFRINFDDWMWHMNDGVLINRSYLKKFGFTVAELTLFMQKQK